jgi:TonB family protein
MEVAEPVKAAGDPPAFRFPELEGRTIHGPGWVGSVFAHAAVIAVMLLAPREMLTMGSPRGGGHVTLVAPPAVLRQTAPNRAPVGREFSLQNLAPQPPLRVPPAIPPMQRALEPPPARQPVALPEPPSVENARVQPAPPPPAGVSAALPAPPQIQPTEERPKLAFETPAAAFGTPKPAGGLSEHRIQPPSTSVNDAARAAMQARGRGVAVGDADTMGLPGLGGGITQLPTPGKTASRLEMMSDPMGVDFKPYLIQILATVKRNWLAVYPESARLGLAGRVQIQFAIDRSGYVPKLVIAMPSGQDALDRAAVAGISASNPFPPLPADFRGAQVRLQFTFTYNLK